MQTHNGPANHTLRAIACPNAFKGALGAPEAAEAIATGIRRAFDGPWRGSRWNHADVLLMPLADGGDGTLNTLVAATGGEVRHASVRGPLGAPVRAGWGLLGGDAAGTAVIEMAEAAGLRLLAANERDPLRASTFGVGELMLEAVAEGCTSLLIGIGGSATNDGGAGMAAALGARFLDALGKELPMGGQALQHLASIDLSRWKLPPGISVRVASDVDNPLLGPSGASSVYGPQKGADDRMVRELDAALGQFAKVIYAACGRDVADMPGAGAAGGLGAGLMALVGASLEPGADLILDILRYDERARGRNVAITGEGKLDTQTERGKVVAAVARRSQRIGLPVVALAGSISREAEQSLRRQGLTAGLSILEGPTSVAQAMRMTAELLTASAERLVRTLNTV